MNFKEPATKNPIDNGKIVGKSTNRIDGPLKTTGQARYAYDQHDVAAHQAYGYILGAAIPKGRIQSLSLKEAKKAPGVISIVTYRNAGELGKGDYNNAKLLAGPDVQHYHQAVAIVVAESFEQARSAANLIDVSYVAEEGEYDLLANLETAQKPKSKGAGEPDSSRGDFDGAFEKASVQLDQTYYTAAHSHAMMEPHATVAYWEGDKLTVWTSNQMIAWSKGDLAKTLQISPENVRLISPYIGGGFGAKLFIRADVVLAALAARKAGRAVKVALTRPLIFNNTTHRAATHQRIRLGTTEEGEITAIGHENWNGDIGAYSAESSVAPSRLLYAGPNRMTRSRVAALNLGEANAMRAPGEAPGMMALEIAIDEMAEKLGMDPIDFRIKNDTQVDPENPSRRFSQRELVACMKEGAKRFDWANRNKRPGANRDDRWLIGSGMAAAFRNSPVMKSAARVTLKGDGTLLVETDMTDIGTGSYTIIAQTAAEMLGLTLEKVDVKLGDSAFPVSAGSGGQWGANSSTSGVYAACLKLREKIAETLGAPESETRFDDERVYVSGEYTELSNVAGGKSLVAEDAIEFGDLSEKYQLSTFGAHFVQVRVDVYTGEIRLDRMLAVCAAGRILNPKSARSQVIGAMTMGVGAALMEELAVDTEMGFFVNHDLAGYEVPVHRDIPEQEVVFIGSEDPKSSPMKAKGVGELGICGVGAAVANAIYNATGVRVREYPIKLDKLIERLPAV